MDKTSLRDFFLKERFDAIRIGLNITLAHIAESLSVSSSYMSDVKNGNKVPSDTVLSLFIQNFSVSETFFKDGTGEMFTKEGLPGRLYLAAKEKGYRVQDLPAVTGVHKKEIAALILGKSRNQATIEKLTLALDLPPHHLLAGETQKNLRLAATEPGPVSVENSHALRMLVDLEKSDTEGWRRAYNNIVKIYLSSKDQAE